MSVDEVIVKAHNVAKMNEVTLQDTNSHYKCMNYIEKSNTSLFGFDLSNSA